jgi:uncharacterized protein YlxP (DUF503 family)
MLVVVCEIELFIPGAGSLKARRRVVKHVVERIRSRCNASVAETGFQDTWQRALVAVAMVSGNRTVLEGQVNVIRDILDATAEAEVVAFAVEYI